VQTTLPSPALASVEAERQPGRLRALSRYPIASALVLAIVVLAGIFAPWVEPHDPNHNNLIKALIGPIGFGGSWSHPLGTDQLGRDVLSRLIAGARISLIVGISVVLGSGTIGTLLALLAGHFQGWVDAIISRVTDIFLAVPFLLVAISIVGAVGAGTRNLVLVLIVMTWASYTRVLRGEVLRVTANEYVRFAKLTGCSNMRIMVKHILPGVLNPLIILATLQLGAIIIIEASLSFLGLGIPPPQATWGGMLAGGKDYIGTADWLTILPGLALALTCLSINLLGDWFRVRFDPRFRQT
jgi:peptide/nickel transport system permease protein